MIDIEIINEQDALDISDTTIDLIKKVVNEALKMENIDAGEVVITLVDNKRIQELNRDYRNIDNPTDVLSFAINDEAEDDLEIVYEDEDVPDLLGDIVISIPMAVQQAEEYGHSFEREIGFLTAHGFLHLVGYDHETDAEEKQMFAKQEQILDNMGLKR